MHRFSDVVRGMINRNIPFFIYRLPSDNIIHCGVQETTSIHQISIENLIKEKGFIIAPFEDKLPFIISPDFMFDLPNDIVRLESKIQKLHCSTFQIEPDSFVEISQQEYIQQCEQYIEHIKGEYLEKAILSRCIKTSELSKQEAGSHFLRLESKYPQAYVFLVNIPGVTTWIGATPETLLKIQNGDFETMALAGTQKWIDGFTNNLKNWGCKEKDEQQIVTRYICEQLRHVKINEFYCDPLSIKKAGGVGHLQTLIHGKVDLSQVNDLIEALHPTPAVCGAPKSEALQLIHSVEKHSRDFYAGYLGFKDESGNMDLFVNLRSARLLNEYGLLYVGGGITADSDPIKEWEETCLKAKTILNALNTIDE